MGCFFRIRLADRVIGVHALHSDIMEMCRDYLTDAEPSLEISVTQEDIGCERRKA